MRTRTSRRASRAGIAALVSFSLVAAACGGSDDDGSSGETPSTESGGEADEPEPEPEPDGESEPEPEPEPADTTGIEEGAIDTEDVVDEPEDTGPVQGGTLRIGLEADVDGINPTTSALSAPGLYMANVVFDNLTAFAADGSGAVPYLAESVTPNEDFTQWQVKLREGISFHDGTPVNAEAIIVNFETQKNDPLVGLAVRPFFPEEGATEVIDDLTVQFNLLEPNVVFPGTLAAQLGYLASPTWLAAALEDPTLNQAPVGTGPFMFDSRSQDSVTRFVRNDDWWGGEVYLDAIEFVPVTDPDTRVDLLFEGDLNSLHTSNPASVADLRDEESVQNVIDETGEESFAMINSAVPPFDDIRARQALTFATPLENYRQLIGLGVARPADQRFIPESQYYNPDVVQQGDDPDAAVALATEYCGEFPENCSDGKINMELQWSGPAVIQTRIAELLTEGWNAAFNVTFDELPQDEHIQQTALGQYNVVTWRQFGAEDPALDNVWLLCRTVGGISLNWPKLCDEERDALLLQAQATTDQAERQELYKQISQKLHDDYVYIFFLHTIWDLAFAENVRGICDRMSPEGVLLTCSTNGRAWPTAAYLAG